MDPIEHPAEYWIRKRATFLDQTAMAWGQGWVPTDSYQAYWDNMFESRLQSLQPSDKEEFIMGICRTIAKAMASLGKDNPAVQHFLSAFPFYLPVDYHGWPPTPEWIRHLMT